MAARVVPGANTVLEVLNLYNYEDWSLQVETYLIAEGLWDVVEATAETPNTGETEDRDWRMKNAKALHAIQMSCRTDVFGFICGIRMAKDAWETLAKRLKPKNRDIKGTAATLVPSVMIDLKALNQDNYEDWSYWVRTYLLAEGLWDIVQGISKPPKLQDGEREAEYLAWRKTNARALQVITIFVGDDDQYDCISASGMAKDAWNILAKKFGRPEISKITREEDSGVDSDDNIDSDDGDADLERIDRSDYEHMILKLRLQYMLLGQEWEDLKELLEQNPEVLRETEVGRRALHTVVFEKQVKGVKALLPYIKKKDLDILNGSGETALSLAIQNPDTDDAIEIVKCIVEKNRKLLLLEVDSFANIIPLAYAIKLDNPKMVYYLRSETPIPKLMTWDAADIVSLALRMKYLDISLDLLRSFPKLAIAKDHSGDSPLNELASTRAGLLSDASQLGIWKRMIYSCIHIPPRALPNRDVSINVPEEETVTGKNLICQVIGFFRRLVANPCHLPAGIDRIYQLKLLHVRTIEIQDEMLREFEKEQEQEQEQEQKQEQDNLNYMQRQIVEKALFQAVERGHVLLVKRLLRLFHMRCSPYITNEHGKTLIQFAAEHRQEEIFDEILRYWPTKLITEVIGRKDKLGNNMLHAVGRLSTSTQIAHIRGAASQMQYELQWFKKVECMASPNDLNCINSEGRTPAEEFTMNHKNLVKEGELSMKETATSSAALVAALIITIMFAAAVTVPGGINGDTGIPLYLHSTAFRIFIVADVISLCSATTSVMVFLGILTSRFAEEDFLTSLPTKLIIGFLTLFLSTGSMMATFSSAVFIMLPVTPSLVIPSIVLAGFPIVSFLWMQFPFLFEIIISTYGSSSWLNYRRI